MGAITRSGWRCRGGTYPRTSRNSAPLNLVPLPKRRCTTVLVFGAFDPAPKPRFSAFRRRKYLLSRWAYRPWGPTLAKTQCTWLRRARCPRVPNRVAYRRYASSENWRRRGSPPLSQHHRIHIQCRKGLTRTQAPSLAFIEDAFHKHFKLILAPRRKCRPSECKVFDPRYDKTFCRSISRDLSRNFRRRDHPANSPDHRSDGDSG